MNPARLQGPDHFLDILDHDMRRHGLPGNIAQLQLHLSGPPDLHHFEEKWPQKFAQAFRWKLC